MDHSAPPPGAQNLLRRLLPFAQIVTKVKGGIASDRVSTKSNSQEKRSQISEMERPRCSVQGCTNLAEIGMPPKAMVIAKHALVAEEQGYRTGQ